MEKKLIEILIWVLDGASYLANQCFRLGVSYILSEGGIGGGGDRRLCSVLDFSLVKKTWPLDQKHLVVSLVTMNKMKMMKETAHYDLKRPKFWVTHLGSFRNISLVTKWASFGPKRPKLSVIMNLGSSPSFSPLKKIAAEDGGVSAGFRGWSR
ncbi:Hypothetical predicted protein [Prunus dulcis]|uniref:Uncharacterized protein n=1 Tax=Prunus dulcis TaxID=3755 RepID=A0A5E4FP20_PRUDU|nr:Hypothetical predicted protein [Prunus dulcis]